MDSEENGLHYDFVLWRHFHCNNWRRYWYHAEHLCCLEDCLFGYSELRVMCILLTSHFLFELPEVNSFLLSDILCLKVKWTEMENYMTILPELYNTWKTVSAICLLFILFHILLQIQSVWITDFLCHAARPDFCCSRIIHFVVWDMMLL